MERLSRSCAEYWNKVAVSEREGGESYPPLSKTLFRPDGAPYVSLECLQLCNNVSVVELGCGNGKILQAVARGSCEAIGIDFSIEQLKNAQKRIGNQSNVTLMQHDLNQGLPFIEKKIHTIYSVYGALDFVENPYQLLLACWELVGPNGRIVILTSKLPLVEIQEQLQNCQMEGYVSAGGKHEAARVYKRTKV